MKPLVISAPAPRSLDLIFSQADLGRLRANYEVVETDAAGLEALPDDTLKAARYVLGQPPVSEALLARLKALRAIFNVEGNLLDNMPYPRLFERGIHVLTTGAVFAQPVAELGLGLALDLARGISEADADFRAAQEHWGLESNRGARLLSGSEIGLIGFGDLGRALNRVLAGFHATIRVFDPWLPPSLLQEQGLIPAPLETVLSRSDTIFVVAAATAENRHFLDAAAFAAMRPGAGLVLLSRADVVDFDALLAAVKSGHIRAASDVFPEEPMPRNHPVRRLPGFLRSAHRAGALDAAFKQMGQMVLEDLDLMDRGLPPMRCKRAERETVALMRSKPVAQS